MVKQIQCEYEVRDEHITHYLTDVETCLTKLTNWRVKHIPLEKNGKANALARVVATLLITKSIMLSVYV